MKNFEKKNLYNSLNNAFEQFEDSPPNKVWDAVEVDLAKKKLDRDRKRFFWMQWSSGIIILFFLTFGIYKLINYSNKKQPANKLNEKNSQTNNNTLANNFNSKNPVTVNPTLKNTKEVPFAVNQGRSNNKIENESSISQANDKKNNSEIPINKIPNKKNIIKITSSKKTLKNTGLLTSFKQIVDRANRLSVNENKDVETLSQTIVQTNTSENQTVKSLLPDNKNRDTKKIESKNDSAITITSLTKSTGDSIIQETSDSSIALVSITKIDSANLISSVNQPKQSNKIFSRISVLGFFSPDYSGRILANNKGVAGASVSQFNKQETTVFAFSSGLKIGCELFGKWSIQTGATYSYMEQTFKPTNIIIDTSSGSDKIKYSFTTSSGTVHFSSDDFGDNEENAPIVKDSVYMSYKANEKLEFINIPLLMRYQLSDKKISTCVIFGTTANILFNKQVKLNVLDSPNHIKATTNKIDGLQKINMGLIIGMGFEYNVFKGLTILIEPTLKCSITSLNKSNSVKSYPYSLGIAVGLGYHF